ncbi:MAG: chloride channel protein [Actinomycetota bacterium]|nr:chloride channel protein [Actinomycetota bacterium]MDH5225106.1 chloride channel protein [Actinomycetota bacterium]MDH5313706.1 chloride channel protein [Actinomycetota bacterium]
MGVRERTLDVLDLSVGRLLRAGYLKKWSVLGALIGVVAGLGAVAFVYSIRFCSWLFLDVIGGYVPPSSVGEGNSLGSAFARPWAVPLAVGLGGLISGVLVVRFAPEAEGHGTDAAIESVHHNPRGMRVRASIVKIVASAVTIGSGGSAGREGPTAQISAGFASMLARRLDLTPTDARIAVAAGIGSGIGAIFRAPLGGAVLGAEILYRDDLEAEAIFPTFVASVTGFSIFAAFEGFAPIFGYLQPGHFDRLQQLPFYAVIGVAAGLAGILYTTTFYKAVDRFRRLRLPAWLKPAVAGVAVGLMGLVIPGVLGTGYGWLQRAMTQEGLESMALWMILALPIAKILSTSLTIGSGGSGGIFGPGMVIGGFVGASIWMLVSGLSGVPASPAPYVVVGMTACFGSVAHAPLAMILMVAEMTGTLELVLPAMVAIGLATLIVGDRSIYEHQLKDRKASPGHRFRSAMPLLASVPVTTSMERATLTIDAGLSAEEARLALSAVDAHEAPVVDGRTAYVGALTLEALEGSEAAHVRALADTTAPSVPRDATLEDAVEGLATTRFSQVPVLDDHRQILGIVTATQAIDGYRLALQSNLRGVGIAPAGTTLVEATVAEDSRLVGRTLLQARLPTGTVVMAILRDDSLLVPGSSDRVEAGDDLMMLVPEGRGGEVRTIVGGSGDAE